MKWNSRNKQIYKDKGYKFTYMKDTFLMKINDVSLGSKVKIKYKCDNCGKIMETLYKTYNKSEDDLCNTCSSMKAGGWNKLSFDTVKEMFNSKGYTLVSNSDDYDNSFSKLKFICNVHNDIIQTTTYSSLQQGHICRLCANSIIGKKVSKARRYKFTNPNSPYYKGDRELQDYLRSQMPCWTHKQLERANYRCEITGKSGILNVHHMYSFKDIVRDTMGELNMDIRPIIGDYTEEELQLITDNFIKNNDLYAQPIVMLQSIHKQFHSFCGEYNNDTSFEQLDEFKKIIGL